MFQDLGDLSMKVEAKYLEETSSRFLGGFLPLLTRCGGDLGGMGGVVSNKT